jgi:F-type H+-transporting ATPase subunit b
MRIDWQTLALQTVNVLILIWILSRFLFRPVMAIIEERRAAAAKLLDDAEAAKRQAITEREAAETEAAKIAAARDEVLRQAAADADTQRAAALAAARAEVEQLRAAAKAEMRSARAAEASAASDRAVRLAVDVAGKVLARLPDSARVEGFVDGLAEALASLPEASRDGIDGAGRLRLMAARALTPGEAQSCRAALARALGRPLDFVFAIDPNLIAGLELETPHAVVRNSIRSDLNRIVEELTRHDGLQH